jgi:arylsulfatase A-like enzyme/cytochrome c-type biogenesis protein CcmH/NrfG
VTVSVRALRRAVVVGALVTAVSCAPAPRSGGLTGWNVLLITIDTLRADRLGFMGYDGAETPVLDALADGGVVFETAVSAAPVTLPAHATILTGRVPPAHGALDNGLFALADGVPTLAGRLRGAGYATAAVIGAYVLHGEYGLDAGFDRYDDLFVQPRPDGVIYRERRAEEVSARAIEWLRSRAGGRPFFLWAHYFDPHVPYDPPGRFRARFATRPYDGEIAYADQEIGTLLDALAASGEAKRTLVVVVADHGEALGDGGERTHGILLREATLRVPLVLSAPGALPHERVTGLVASADVMPTVLDLLGCALPDSLDGISLVDCMTSGRSTGRAVFSETRLPADTFGWAAMARMRTDRWAWVRAPIPELYDLETDPHELRSLHEEHTDTAAALDRRVDEVLERPVATAARGNLSEEEVEALRSLGYLVSGEVPEFTGADPKERLDVWNRMTDMEGLVRAGRFAEAADGLGDVLRDDPGNPAVRILHAEALARCGRAEEALADLRILRDTGRIAGRMGDLYARTLAEAGRPDEAEALLRTLRKTEPEEADHAYNLGVLLAGQNRREDAIEPYESALRANPDAVHVLTNLAMTLVASRGPHVDADRVLRLIGHAVELSPQDDRPRLLEAEIRWRLGQHDEARAILRDLAGRSQLQGITRQNVADMIRRLGPRG